MKTAKGLTLVISMIAAFVIGGCSAQQTASVNEADPAEEAAVTEPAETEEENADVSAQEPEEEEVEEPEEEPLPATVMILGTEYDRGTTSLDLSGCTPEDVPEIAGIICDMPKLKTIGLMDEEDTSLLSPADVSLLKEAAPDAEIIYSFDLFDQRISVSDNAVKYKNAEIGNEGEESIRDALSILNDGTYFVLDDCGIDDEVMAGIRDDFPAIKVVWRVHVGNKSALTDDTVIRMTHGIDDSMTGPLQYCTDVVYMDLGHDSGITEISFVSNMHDLECLVLSSASVSDLTPLQNCTALTWLELVYCGRLDDISPIAGMDSIKYLNISFTGIRDISPIEDMEFDRFNCIGNRIPEETIEEYKEAHPDCIAVFSGTPWGYGWRYDDHGYTFFSYYKRMREVFRYEERSPGGFKFPEDEEPEEQPQQQPEVQAEQQQEPEQQEPGPEQQDQQPQQVQQQDPQPEPQQIQQPEQQQIQQPEEQQTQQP